jgi:hypothetical protein
MIRIALLGNSHLHNWKRAWNSLSKAYPEVEFVFFAAPGRQIMSCEPRGDRIVFTSEDVTRCIEITSGGRREAVVADYDAFCVVGLACDVRSVVGLYSTWRADSHKGEEGRFEPISDACFQDAVVDLLKVSLAMELVGKLRQITNKAIFLVPAPAPAETILRLDTPPDGIDLAAAATDALSLGAAYDEALRRLAADDLMVLEQPKETLASPLLSKTEYRQRSWMRSDWQHLNDAYGELMIRALLSRFEPSLGDRTADGSSRSHVLPANPLLAALRSRFSQLAIRRSSKG